MKIERRGVSYDADDAICVLRDLEEQKSAGVRCEHNRGERRGKNAKNAVEKFSHMI